MSRKKRNRPSAGARLRLKHKDGPQVVRSDGKRWTAESEALFLDRLGASCNVTWAAAEAGFTEMTAYYHRRRDPVFAQRWRDTLAQGYLQLETELVRAAMDYLAGKSIEESRPIKDMTVKEAIAILGLHRRNVECGRSARWSRPRSLDEVRDSILAKLDAIEGVRAKSRGASDEPPAA